MSHKHPAQLVSVVFRLERSKLERVRKLSAESRILQSEFFREAIADVLAKHGHVLTLLTCSRCKEIGSIDDTGRCAPCRALQLQWEISQLTCGCGRSYTWRDYLALPTPIGGGQQESEDDDGQPIMLELRQCACHNTMARLVGPCPPGWAP